MLANMDGRDAQKIRADIMGKISSSKKERGTTNMTSRFEEVEQTMAEYDPDILPKKHCQVLFLTITLL